MFAYGFAFCMAPHRRGGDDRWRGRELLRRVLDRRVDASHNPARRKKGANVRFRKMPKRGAYLIGHVCFVTNCRRKRARICASGFSHKRTIHCSIGIFSGTVASRSTPSMYRCPHSHIARTISSRSRPISVNEYSTRGGTCGYISR